MRSPLPEDLSPTAGSPSHGGIEEDAGATSPAPLGVYGVELPPRVGEAGDAILLPSAEFKFPEKSHGDCMLGRNWKEPGPVWMFLLKTSKPGGWNTEHAESDEQGKESCEKNSRFLSSTCKRT